MKTQGGGLNISFLQEYKCDSHNKREDFFAANEDIKEMYEEILHTNETSTEESRKASFNRIKRYALEHSPFYKKYGENDVLPIMTKVDLIEHHDSIFVPEFIGQKLHTSSTSGSTGIPLTIEQNAEKRRRTIADLKVYGLYANYPSHEKMLQLRAYSGKELDRTIDIQNNIWRYDISFLTEDTMPQLIEFINLWKPTIIFGYDSTVDSISRYILENDIKLTYQCSSVLVGGEMLSDEAANRMNKAFGCPVYDRYSNMEMGIYAQREYGKTDFLFNVASYFLEIIKLDKDEPAKEGEIGRIVVTDLYNKAFPMLRYDTGDLGSFIVKDDIVYLKDVLGRRIDTIFGTNSKAIDPHIISRSMCGIEGIKQWQFIQKTKDSYLIKIVPNGSADFEEIKHRLKSILGDDAIIKFDVINSIPVTNSQKTRYIINEM